MKCNHKDADGAESIVKGKCGICGIDQEQELKKHMTELKCHIKKIEAEKNKYLEENKNLKEVIRSLSKVI